MMRSHARRCALNVCAGGALILCAAIEAPLRAHAQSADVTAEDQQIAFRAAAAAVAPFIVRIETIGGAQPVQTEERGGEKIVETAFRQADGPTTGVVWTSDGYIVTSSFNFIRDPSIITVTLADGKRFVAKLIARDRPARLALLKVDATDLRTPVFASPRDLRIGQWMLTAGFGHGGDKPAISVGILSAVERSNGITLQTDAKTSPLNYGGPLFDLDGRVAGVCVPMGMGMDEIAGVDWYDSGIGFAASVDRVAYHLSKLKSGADVQRGYLGIALAPRESDVPRALTETLGAKTGMIIGVPPRGPALAAGLAAGDLITHLDDLPTPHVADFRKALWRKGAGESIRVRYVRDGKVAEVDVTLGKQDDFKEKPASAPAAEKDDAEPPATPEQK